MQKAISRRAYNLTTVLNIAIKERLRQKMFICAQSPESQAGLEVRKQVTVQEVQVKFRA